MADVRWWPGRGHSVAAELVVEEVRALESEFGVAQPAALVERARPDASPLHELFEWDDGVAAEQYRVGQARQIIRSVRITFHEVERVAPAFVSVNLTTADGSKRGYVDTLRALSDDKMRQQVVDEALRQIKAWQRRYAMLKELAGLVDAIGGAMPDEDPGIGVADAAGQGQEG